MSAFATYADRHRGAVAWLFGAGPSLDAFLAARPFIPAEDLIVGVNEVPTILAAHGISCAYGFAADRMDHYGHALPPRLPLFVTQEVIDNARAPLPANDLTVVPPGNARGTIILAARVLQHMGIRQVIAIGLDGGSARADQPWLSPPSLDRRAYGIIRELFVDWCHRAGLPLTFWSVPASVSMLPRQGTRVADFLDAHPGATGFVFGKGPSLDAFLAGRHRIATPISGAPVLAFLSDTLAYRAQISRTIEDMLGCYRPDGQVATFPSYAFANDAITRWHHVYAPGDVLFQPRRTLRDPSLAAPAANCRVIAFEDSGGNWSRLESVEALLANGLVAHHGTCESAAQILRIMGCTRLVAVGCDGTPGRSLLEWCTAIRDDHAADYADLRRDFERVLLALDLPTEFYGEPRILVRSRTNLRPGAVRLTRPTVFRGQGCDAGTEFTDCTPAEVQTLVGCNKAEPVYSVAGRQ